MEFSIKSGSPEKQRTGCVVVGVFENRKLTLAAELLDNASGRAISEVLRRGDMEGKLGSTLMLHHVAGIFPERVLLVGLGKEKEFRDEEYRRALRASYQALNTPGCTEAVSFLTETPVKKRELGWRVEQAVALSFEVSYRFDEFKTDTREPARALRKLTLNVPRRPDLAEGEAALAMGLALGQAQSWARDLANRPGNVCTPSHLVAQAQSLAEAQGLRCVIHDQSALEALGMRSFLSVAKGSEQSPYLIELHYQGAAESVPPVVLVGKGITFDSGGISLKPGEGMDEMKYDMCGAASVLATMQACAQQKLPLNLIVLVPCCENMPNGRANKPGDIIATMSGKTVEILNTDAEGRLILCDALTYATRFEPAAVVDVATLTGACVIALGSVNSGLFGNQQSLIDQLLDAADESGDKAWPMPLDEQYQEQLKSPFADLANIGGRPAGSVTAACFLSRFAQDYPWAHLDIAGTAWKSGAQKGATGRPVPLLVQFLRQHAEYLVHPPAKRGRQPRERMDDDEV